MPKSKAHPPVTKNDILLARALSEAAKRHLTGFDHELEEDRETGESMLRVLNGRFPDLARAFADADRLRQALRSGYLPPAEGATSKSVQEFLSRSSDGVSPGTKRAEPTQERSARDELLAAFDREVPF